MLFLQLSEVGMTIVWQEFWACLFVFQVGIIAGILARPAWRLYKKLTEGEEDEIARLKHEEKQRGKSDF